MSFTHLQVRSGYSLFQSTMTIDKIVEHAEMLNYRAIALTDERVLYGAVAFYEACIGRGIQPILGLVVPYIYEGISIPIIFYAKNNTGYEQLIKMSTVLETEESPTIEELAMDELIAIVPADNEYVQKTWTEDQLDKFLQTVSSKMNKEDLYIGISHTMMEETNIEKFRTLEQTFYIKAVAIHDVRYAEQKDYIAYDCLQAMHDGRKWDEKNVQEKQVRYMKSEDEMKRVFQYWPELMDRTEEIVEKCYVHFDFNRVQLPAFPVEEGETAASFLRTLCEKNLQERYPDQLEAAKKRLDMELQVIHDLQFDDYFLIVQDFVQYAKDNGIVVGPGRGSAAGSIVSYLLHITDVDPLKYDLLFERFLNPNRVSMPDIDIDFSDNRRDEVIQYVKQKYGADYVAQIITFGTFAARSLLRELMKTMQVHDEDQQYILRKLPQQRQSTILEVVQDSPDLKKYIKASEKLRRLFSIAMKLEGLPRHISTHAAGIVIGKDKLIQHVPLTHGIHETYLTQYAMNELEKIGLLKMDILGLRNLTLLERIVTSIERTEKVKIDLHHLPENDPKTFALLQKGQTNGIFQLESDGMKSVLRRLKPTSLDDVVAVNALFRPGPMDYIPTYIERKHGTSNFSYLHPDLAPILEKTYGVLIYQEQIMQIAHTFAGLSLGEADILRRAVSKKDHQEMTHIKERFIQGCAQKGYDATIAEEVFSWIIKFADYGFNKSHSVAYSKIAYQLSYLKANYPTHFFAHILSAVANEPEKMISYISEAKQFGIQILPPSVNKSFAYFSVEEGNIRIGLLAMKGIGYETAKLIMQARKEGAFKDLFDFTFRCKGLKRNALEIFILAGALDDLYDNRASLLASIDQAYERTELFGSTLFSKMDMSTAYVEMEDFSLMEKLQEEKNILNMYVSSHPFESIRTKLSLEKVQSIAQIKELAKNSQIRTVGIVESFRKTHTKRSETMAFATVSDEFSEIDIVVFPSVYRQISHWFKEESIVMIQGKTDSFREKKQLIANEITPFDLEAWKQSAPKTIYIKLSKDRSREEALSFLRQIARTNQGDGHIVIFDERENKAYMLEKQYKLNVNDEIMQQLHTFFGAGFVVLK